MKEGLWRIERLKNGEPKRAAFHVFAVNAAMAYFYFSEKTGAYILLGLGIIISLIDFFRAHYPWGRSITPSFMLKLVRKDEEGRLSAITHFIIAATLVDFLYLYFGLSKDFVLAATMFVSFADPAARLAGKEFGSGNLFGTRKTLVGSATFFFVGSAAALTVCAAFAASFSYFQIILGGLILTVVELFSGRWDNFTVPFLGSLIMWVLFYV